MVMRKTRGLGPVAACALLCGYVAPALATDKPQEIPPFYVEAADCSAAFESSVKALLKEPRTTARDEAILHETEGGFIFVGVAYKQGLRNPQADELLHAAEARWDKLSRDEQAKRLQGCRVKASALMDEVTFIERYLVRNRAQARVDRLLSKEKPPS